MFTGIIQEIGTVSGASRTGRVALFLRCVHRSARRELHVDDSVAVNGVCQTVVRSSGETL